MARDAILSRADTDRRQSAEHWMRGAGEVVANACYSSGDRRAYCEVMFDRYFYDGDRYCVTGYTANRSGGAVRHVKIGDPEGPGYECGKLSEDGDPLPLQSG